MLHQPSLAGQIPQPQATLHTTSDLLRLLAADAHPFAAVAEAVSARFGGGAESQAWLARTLVTLLRDGLLYTEAEKLNAAYLLRFSAATSVGSREALLYLSLPAAGEPPAVRAWAAALAQPMPGDAHAAGGSAGGGSMGSTSSSPMGSPTWQHQQARAQALAAATVLHQRTPRQVLAEAAPPVVVHGAFGQLQLGQPPSPLLWQGHSGLAAPASQHPMAEGHGFPGSPSLAPSVPPWLQQPPPLSPQHFGQPMSPQHPGQPMSPLHNTHPMSPQYMAAQLSPQHMAAPMSPQHAPPPLQLAPPGVGGMVPSLVAQQLVAAQQAQQAQQNQLELASLKALLQQAAQAPLVPAMQQRLVLALSGPVAAPLTAPMAAAVNTPGVSSGSGSLHPHHMRGLVEQNCGVASQLLLALLAHYPEAAAVYCAAVAELPMSAQTVECISSVVAGGGELPGWVLATFLANCTRDISASSDAGRQSRHVKLLCACVAQVLQRQPHALAESLPELLAFCVQQSRHKQAADLYRQLRDMEGLAA